MKIWTSGSKRRRGTRGSLGGVGGVGGHILMGGGGMDTPGPLGDGGDDGGEKKVPERLGVLCVVIVPPQIFGVGG